MEIKEIRRERLRQWFEHKTFPQKEKSYLSQLISGTASFGEKAARRLEKEYGMSAGYLDQPSDVAPVSAPINNGGLVSAEVHQMMDQLSSGLREVIQNYMDATPRGREKILDSSREAPKAGSGRETGVLTTTNKS